MDNGIFGCRVRKVMSINRYKTFGDAEVGNTEYADAKIVILPLCYEVASSYGTGSGQGPHHILTASEHLENIDDETLTEWSRLGIHTHVPVIPSEKPEDAIIEMKRIAEKILSAKKFLLSFGGDHAICLGPILAASGIYDHLGILQIDAHLDLRDQWNGSKYNHACVMRRVVDDMDLTIVPVGIRSFSPEEAAFVQEKNISPFYAHQIHPFKTAWMEDVVNSLPENVYVTIDLDGLDPSVIPGTGTPEPGGLSYRQLVGLLKCVGKDRKVVAADINELAKIPGTRVSEFTAAKIATKIMVYCASPIHSRQKK